MHTKDAKKFFAIRVKDRRRSDKTMATTRIAKVLNISSGSVSQWGEIVPKGSAETLHRISFYKIPLKLFHYDKIQNKFCPNCAEIAKLAAKKCSGCQHQF